MAGNNAVGENTNSGGKIMNVNFLMQRRFGI